MKARLSNILWGLAFIIVGICYAGNAFNWWNFDLFFEGWWTLFIIVPCLWGLIVNGFGLGKLIGLIVGLILLLSEQQIINSEFIDKMIFPIILVVIGINILSDGRYKKEKEIDSDYSIENDKSNNINTDKINLNKEYTDEKEISKEKNYTAIFSGIEERITNELFRHANLLALFGGIDFDLKDSYIENEAKIKVVCIFGGVDIFLPKNVKVRVSSVPILGGTSNLAENSSDDNAPIIYVEAICICGGVDIK